MKTDYSLKYIFFEDDGREYCVMFKSTFLKGIYDIKVRRWDTGEDVPGEKECYPNLIERIKDRIASFRARERRCEGMYYVCIVGFVVSFIVWIVSVFLTYPGARLIMWIALSFMWIFNIGLKIYE